MDRIELRPVVRGDATALIAANQASLDYHRPWVDPFIDQAGFEAWCSENDPTRLSLVARERLSGEIVGVLNLNQIFRKGFQNAYLGFYGMRPTAGRGLMTEALKAVVRHAFQDLGLHRLEANVQPDNARSLALVARAGFRKEGFSPRYLKIAGQWRDHERWAILADEA